jgi:hypothetical protein
MATIKQILNDVLTQSGFLERPAFFTNTDPDVRQMVSIANAMGVPTDQFADSTGPLNGLMS